MGLWGAAQAIAFGLGGFGATVAVDLARSPSARRLAAYALVFAVEALLFVVAAALARRSRRAPQRRARDRAIAGRMSRRRSPGGAADDVTDRASSTCVVVGGGPAGATAAHDLARRGRTRAAARPRRPHQALRRRHPAAADQGFRHPRPSARGARQLGAHDLAHGRRGRHADRRRLRRHGRPRAISTNGCARARAAAGATRVHRHLRADRRATTTASRVVHYRAEGRRAEPRAAARARRDRRRRRALRRWRARQCPGADKTRFVFAYHEIVARRRPAAATTTARAATSIIGASSSPDFYAWVFPHGDTMSIGTGSANKGFSLRNAVRGLRDGSRARRAPRRCAAKARRSR